MTHTIFKQKNALIFFLHDGQIALFFVFFCSRIFFMKEPIRVEGVKKFLQVIFSVLGFAFSPNMYCKKLVREGAKKLKIILEAVIVVKTIIFPLVRDSSFQSLHISLLF